MDTPGANWTAAADPVNATMLHVAHWNEVDSVIRQADLKAQVLLGIDALLLAGLSRSDVSLGGIAPVDTPLEFVTLVLLLISIAMALATVTPRRGQTTSSEALLYFAAIAAMPVGDFVGRYLAMEPDDLLAHVAHEIHAKSRVAVRKLSRIRTGVLLLAMAAGTWSLGLVIGT